MNSTDANKFDFMNYFEIWHKQCERFGSVGYIGEVAGMGIRKEDAAAQSWSFVETRLNLTLQTVTVELGWTAMARYDLRLD